MRLLREISIASSLLTAHATALCYSGATSFETGSFAPDYTSTTGGVISHGMHFAGFSIVNDGTPSSPNTGVSDEDYPYFIAFNLAAQGPSAKLRPSMQLGSPSQSFSLRTVDMACFADRAGRSTALPVVECDITLTCYRGGRPAGSQVLEYSCGGGGCGSGGLRNAPMQAAPLDVATFACCQKIAFSATPKARGADPVAVGLDTFSFYYSSASPIGGEVRVSDAACGCSG